MLMESKFQTTGIGLKFKFQLKDLLDILKRIVYLTCTLKFGRERDSNRKNANPYKRFVKINIYKICF